MSEMKDVLRRSVVADDVESARSGSIFFLMLPSISIGSSLLPPFWSISRDWELYQTIFRESQWANAVFKAISKMASLSWSVEGDIPLRVRRAREMLLSIDLDC